MKCDVSWTLQDISKRWGDGGAGVVAGHHGGGGTRNREGTLMRLELSAHRETPQESHVLEGSRVMS